MAILNGVFTVISMLMFFGIIWWAWSKHRVKDNDEAARLPFALPDEGSDQGNRNKGYGS
ncbi:CcoQ/FixQ family Cbb3-type cytochrome c oxidase assembly chaperone [Advenella alkanexedens]|uniref:CcoQ/FixQ family Cbb3-type cytochrome c oxidase assembly chaperone n=1 Tax=Advenella alkanexedens TaxID=1481665 RepID=A0ABS6NJP5_9BURK|nr:MULTISPECIES: CcoQ/FixQ family Cbb3-type cytochrome c oxidase assembly chaperone [Advenella]MBV4395844.1 CcoQ/FixQ family Cbb3-type cytochrome c oxidase assembly chaperone [Advenella alkanexedens]MDD3757366.1 CcoQ/FixQ family Cbb3-type cytochrome c oxidase assembly chaperone [Advenella sp.]